jgi:hypothetical protein
VIPYAGIGSRKTPAHVLKTMTAIARRLQRLDYQLRSGGADGPDSAFEAGAGTAKRIFLPWPKFNGRTDYLRIDPAIEREAFEIARLHHPNWKNLTRGERALHTRNVYQVLGEDLNSPSKFIICWTLEGREIGGTSQALRLAKTYTVPVYNLGAPGGEARVASLLVSPPR